MPLEDTPRVRRAFAFQAYVLGQMMMHPALDDVQCTRKWMKKFDPSMTEHDLNKAEKKYGDITFIIDGKRHFVEVCFSNKQDSGICEMKRQSFTGSNKWYLHGSVFNKGEVRIMNSESWGFYLGKCPTFVTPRGFTLRSISVDVIFNGYRKSHKTIDDFISVIRG